jgi:hypothetical protein
VKLDLSGAHRDYRGLMPPIFEDLLRRYPMARLDLVRVGPPRRKNDTSMGFYDQDAREIRFNSYWFAEPVALLRRAAMAEPLFHGPMTDEPRHVVAHEMFHAIQRGIEGIEPRMRRAWEESTRRPELMPADYGLGDEVEHLAELGALVEMGLATDEQAQILHWIMGV